MCDICSGIDPELNNVENADRLGVSEATIRRHRKGHDSDSTYRGMPLVGATVRDPESGSWHRYRDTGDSEGPKWPVVQPAKPVKVKVSPPKTSKVRATGMKLSLKCADTQIGFRNIDGEMSPFHDIDAMSLFADIVRREQPDSVVILGDFLDLPSQGRFAQEASFAQTTQAALDAGHQFLATLRAAAPEAEIVLVEGNHDKRLQNFVETNALAAFGLRRANLPESWPVMSLPWLLRLDELGVIYHDAYPAATHWDNSTTRNIHGTKANSKGSTTAQYSNELPHLNSWVGHTHRCEITYKTVMGPGGEALKTYSANPGALCRIDGAVPSVNGAIGADGHHVRIVEDWQQGFGACYYTETESWPFVYQIRDGVVLYNGEILTAS